MDKGIQCCEGCRPFHGLKKLGYVLDLGFRYASPQALRSRPLRGLVLREASPINHVHSGLPPFLLVHGTADMSVPYSQSVQLQAKLRAAGVSCDLMTIDDGVHGMARWEGTDPGYKDKVIDWLVSKLGVNPNR